MEAILEHERRAAREKEARHKLEADRLRRQIKELRVRCTADPSASASLSTTDRPMKQPEAAEQAPMKMCSVRVMGLFKATHGP